MKKFIVTSSGWIGEAEILYNDKGHLVKISFENCTIPNHRTVVLKFKEITPVLMGDLQDAFSKTSATVVEAEFEVTFDMFWQAYNHKINKARTLPLWNKLSKTDQVKAYYGIAPYDKYLKKESWMGKQLPENYIRNKSWENEYK